MTLLASYCTGLVLGSFGVARAPLLLAFSLLTSIVGYRKKRLYLIGLAGLFLGFWYARQWRAFHWSSITSGTYTFSGVVSWAPDIRGTTQYIRVDTLDIPATQLGLRKPVTLQLEVPKYAAFSYGDRIHVTAKLEQPSTRGIPRYTTLLEKDGIVALGKAGHIRVTEHDQGTLITGFLYKARANLERRISAELPEPASSFLAGLLLGSKRAIPSDITDALKATGTSHLVAISGANVTIVSSFLMAIIPSTNLWVQAILTATGSTLLSILTGNAASVLRGAIIVSLGRCIRALGRRPWPLATLLITATCMLTWNPLYARADPSFQLSFAAYSGLIALSGITELIARRIRVPQHLRSSFSETLAASFGTAPVSIFNGSGIAPIGLLVNPLVLWLIPATTLFGIVLVVTPTHPLRALIAIPTWILLTVSLRIIAWFSHL